jgi:uncharacterized damage-inducible protein DinB
MQNAKLLLGSFVVLCCAHFARAQFGPVKTSGDALNASLSIVEQDFVPAADAMPEDKYSFAPSNGEFKSVRTFAQEVKHVAAVNYMFGANVMGQMKPPVEVGGENGPDSIKSKAEIMQFLKDSFAYLHKAMGSISSQNELDMIAVNGQKVPRLSLASFAVAHPLDHYGQMVEYLRMNGIIPPASRPQPKK